MGYYMHSRECSILGDDGDIKAWRACASTWRQISISLKSALEDIFGAGGMA